jgi:NitT/TauT family transport system substrate-binding protein
MLVAIVLAFLAGALSEPATAQTKLVVATPHQVFLDTGLVIEVGKQKGFFKEVGLEVEPIVVRGGGENVQAVVSGSVHVSLATGTFSVLSAFQKGAPVKILAAEMTGTPDLFWYSMATSPYRKLEDLAGKRIGFSQPGSSTHMGVLAAVDLLKAKGLPAPQPISLGGPSDSFTAVKTGQADAGWSATPLLLDLIEKGEVRIVFRGTELERLRDVTMRVTFANANFVEKNPETVRAFFKAYQKAMDFILEHRQEAARIWIPFAKLKASEATLVRAMESYERANVAFKPVKGIPTLMEDAVKFKFLKQPMTQAELDRLIDLRYLP